MPAVSLVTRWHCVLPPMAKGLHRASIHQQLRMGSHQALDEQAPGTDWMKFIPGHQGINYKEGTRATRVSLFQQQQPTKTLTHQATPAGLTSALENYSQGFLKELQEERLISVRLPAGN